MDVVSTDEFDRLVAEWLGETKAEIPSTETDAQVLLRNESFLVVEPLVNPTTATSSSSSWDIEASTSLVQGLGNYGATEKPNPSAQELPAQNRLYILEFLESRRLLSKTTMATVEHRRLQRQKLRIPGASNPTHNKFEEGAIECLIGMPLCAGPGSFAVKLFVSVVVTMMDLMEFKTSGCMEREAPGTGKTFLRLALDVLVDFTRSPDSNPTEVDIVKSFIAQKSEVCLSAAALSASVRRMVEAHKGHKKRKEPPT